jgi:hypothetical protein
VLDRGTAGIWLVEWPVTAITAVTIDGTVQTLSDFYTRRPAKFGMLQPLSGFWPCGRQLIEVTHDAGWATVPDSLCAAATQIVILRFNTDSHMGLAEERIGQYGYKMGTPGGSQGGESTGGGFPGTLAAVLGNWARPFATGT